MLESKNKMAMRLSDFASVICALALVSLLLTSQYSSAQTILPTNNSGELLPNGIRLPTEWPPRRQPTQQALLPSYLVSPPAIIPIDMGRQLFVDDFLVEASSMTRIRHRPVSRSTPVAVPSGSERGYAMPFSDGVWFDPQDNRFKMFYYGGDNFVWLRESTDGINWIQPGIKTFYPGGGRDSITIWLDLEELNSARRYKAFVYYPVGSAVALFVYFSPDGRNWTRHNVNGPNISDRTTVFYNPWRKVWVDSIRARHTLPAIGSVASRLSRSRFYAESRDLNSWIPSDPNNIYSNYFWTSADVNDPPYSGNDLPELYNLDAVAYESVFVGLFSWYYPQNLLVELGEGFSRDGYQWHRPFRGSGPNGAFIPASNVVGTWNGFNTQSAGGGFLIVGNELWFYFSARSGRHGESAVGSTGLAVLRRDGFYSMKSGSNEATLTTRPVQFSGKHLFVNINNPSGALAVEVLDRNNAPIAPFTRQNSQVIRTNSTKQMITWNGAADLSSIAGQAVKFKFYLTNGDLYSFWVSRSASGESLGYVAAGGPGFTTTRDIAGGPAPTPTPVPRAVCDLDSSGRIEVPDVQICSNQVAGISACTNGDVDSSGQCNVLDIQRIVNGVLGGSCP